jgi:response regulator RpfG family c-di-GMP phosphodiesterase
MISFIGSPNTEISGLYDQLKNRNFEVSSFDTLFEFKKKTAREIPQLILVADNLKEKNTVDLLNSIQGIPEMNRVPIIGLVTSDDEQAPIAFLQNGAVDAVRVPFNVEEVIVRIHLRMQESQLRQHFTSSQFFWNESQEKEQVKRTGIFRFFDSQNTEVGNVIVEKGRLVHATYGSLIKEDAFLQLACNEFLKFTFEDLDTSPQKTINESITNLLMEAAKLKDEIKKQEAESDSEIKVLVIDENRIARIMASRVIKNRGYICKVTSPTEMTVRFMANFAPQMLIIDHQDSLKVMNMLWPTPRTDEDIPVFIYCDEDMKDINFNNIKQHRVSGTVYKNKFHEEFNSILKKANII